MGNAIKSALAGMTPTIPSEIPVTPPPAPSVVEAQVSKKTKEMFQGKTEAKVKRLTAERDAARIELDQARQDLGERIGDGLDTSVAMDKLARAESRVNALEAALVVWKRKDEEARAALDQAERQEEVEAEVAAVRHLKQVGLKVDRLFADLSHLVASELIPVMSTATQILTASGIREGELNFLSEAPLFFKQQLLLSAHALTREGFVPVNMRKYERWSDCVPDPDFVRSMKRTG